MKESNIYYNIEDDCFIIPREALGQAIDELTNAILEDLDKPTSKQIIKARLNQMFLK